MIKLIVVNKNDREIGLGDKIECHQQPGILHRAFTILIFNNKNQLLLQKRSKEKFLWPLTWEASCSGHPKKGESYIGAGEKRLKQELNFSCKLKLAGKFSYYSKYKNIGSEREVCAFLVGRYNGKVRPNKKEAADYRWIDPKELKRDLNKNSKKYAPWLNPAFKLYEKQK
jgi:isopentenyl-diphosphate delta-isomerase